MVEQGKVLRVLVAEKSSYSRLVLQDIIDGEAGLRVVGAVADGDRLLLSQRELQADVILLDYDLPQNEQLLTLKRIFSEEPAPVLLLVTREQLTLEMMQQAVELGVYGIIIKPGKGTWYINYRSITDEILLKVKAGSGSQHWDGQRRLLLLNQVIQELVEKPRPKRGTAADVVIVIGASTGGTQAVEAIIRQLSPTLKATVLVALHLPQSFTANYALRLQELTELKVAEGQEGMILKKGKVIVAPGGRNMMVRSVMGNKANLMVSFADEESETYDMPSIDLLMQSVSKSTVPHIVGVILTGMGRDGTEGASYIQRRGGIMIAQDEESSSIFGMARSAIESGYIDKVLPLSEIADFLNNYVAGQHQVSATDSLA
jgi:two-component system, chemotaxis family, protein-glutamate methylesterase/glutaminase